MDSRAMPRMRRKRKRAVVSGWGRRWRYTVGFML